MPDLLLARDLLAGESLARVREACEGIFAHRGAQPWPPTISIYPAWPAAYAALVEQEGFPISTIAEAIAALREFIVEIASAPRRASSPAPATPG